MSNWKQTSIGDFIDFNPAETLPKDIITKKIPMAKLTEFTRKITGYEFAKYNAGPKFRNGDTLVAKITPCLENGKTAYVDVLDKQEVAFGSSEFIVLRGNQNSDSKFVYYLARSPLFRERAISCMEGTSGRKRVNEGALKRQEILVPKSKNDQKKIASVLSSLDDKIELNNCINTELEAMAKLIYEYWFVQFDFPDKDGKPYKSSGGKMVWNKELKREIPEGWEIVGLEDLAEFNPSLKIERNSEAPYLGMTSISTTGYMTDVPEKKEFSGGIKFQNGDVVVARITPCLENGKTALITMLEEGSIGFGSTEFINIRAKENSHVSFLAILSRSDLFRHYAISKMTGTSGRKRVDAKDLAKFQLAKPSSELLKKYGEIVKSYFEKMTINSKQNQELASLRDWLLPMLMNGQVTVADAEEMVEEKLGMVAEPVTDYERPQST